LKITKVILAGTATVTLISSGALAQQNLTGLVTKVYRANGKITIQQTQSGTVGANTGGVAEDFEIKEGLRFDDVQAGDRLIFTVEEIGGVKTITKLQKQ